MKKYFFLFPGDVYALEFYGHNEREAREAARNWLGVNRLPNGTEVWRGE